MQWQVWCRPDRTSLPHGCLLILRRLPCPQWCPKDPSRALLLDSEGSLFMLSRPEGPSSSCSEILVVQDSALSCASWSLDGASLLCGTTDGRAVRYAAEAGSAVQALAGPPSEAHLCCVQPLNEHFTLLGFGQEDESAVAAVHLQSAEVQDCGTMCFVCSPREDPHGGDSPPRRRIHVATLPEWRMAVVCTSDSDEVSYIGSRNREPQRWQRWTLPDEEGPPAVPPFEDSDQGIFEDQYIMGLAVDLTNTGRLTLIAGARVCHIAHLLPPASRTHRPLCPVPQARSSSRHLPSCGL